MLHRMARDLNQQKTKPRARDLQSAKCLIAATLTLGFLVAARADDGRRSIREPMPTDTGAASVPTAGIVDTTPPAPPTGLRAIGSSQGIALDWNDNAESDLAGYNVYRSTTSSGPWTNLNASLLTTSEYDDTTAQPGVTSYYAVVAVDNSGNVSDAAETSCARLFTTIRWSSAAAAPLKRLEAFGAVANGKLYVFGGYY